MGYVEPTYNELEWPLDMFASGSFSGAAVGCTGDNCPFIVGGSDSAISVAPHQVALIRFVGIIPVQFCGGSLVSGNKVLTAAHCFDPEEPGLYFAVLGISNLLTGFLDPNIQLVQVENIDVHESWTPDYIKNDIAMLTLVKPVTLTEFVAPIELPGFFDGYPGTDCVISGWGAINGTTGATTGQLQSAESTTMQTFQCAIEWFFLTGVWGNVDFSEICNRSAGRDNGPWSGDSGGPLTCNNKLVGIVSWGTQGCDTNRPSVFFFFFFFLQRVPITPTRSTGASPTVQLKCSRDCVALCTPKTGGTGHDCPTDPKSVQASPC